MKNKAKLININIPEYWVEVADDYHEFKNIEYEYKVYKCISAMAL